MNLSDGFDEFDLDEFDASHLEAKLLKELEALEAANIHAIISTEDQANQIISQIDNTLKELTVIDDWLNHYTTVLDAMGADVHQVELRNKQLQTTQNNQNLLVSLYFPLINTATRNRKAFISNEAPWSHP
jgi:hypothetical protein